MIIDSSAIVAILRFEPEADSFLDKIEAAHHVSISASNYLEVGIVLDGRQEGEFASQLDEWLLEYSVDIVPTTALHARLAREAHRRFGRGSGHPAKLNFGDCFAYALAKETGEPLLFKGNDFTETDLVLA